MNTDERFERILDAIERLPERLAKMLDRPPVAELDYTGRQQQPPQATPLFQISVHCMECSRGAVETGNAPWNSSALGWAWDHRCRT